MGSQRAIVEDLIGHDDDLDFDPMDVVFYSSNNIPGPYPTSQTLAAHNSC